MGLINYIIENKIKSPAKLAFVCNDEYLNYEELYEKVRIISFNLKKNNLKKGDKIAIIYYNSIIYPQIFYSAANLDLSIAPLNPSLSKEDIINQLNKLNVKYLFSWHAYLKGLNFNKIKLNKKNCVDLDSSSKIFKNFSEFLVNPEKKYILKKKSSLSKSNFLLGLTSGSTSNPKVTIFSQQIKILRSKHAKKYL